jgi:hypothetical protein
MREPCTRTLDLMLVGSVCSGCGHHSLQHRVDPGGNLDNLQPAHRICNLRQGAAIGNRSPKRRNKPTPQQTQWAKNARERGKEPRNPPTWTPTRVRNFRRLRGPIFSHPPPRRLRECYGCEVERMIEALRTRA